MPSHQAHMNGIVYRPSEHSRTKGAGIGNIETRDFSWRGLTGGRLWSDGTQSNKNIGCLVEVLGRMRRFDEKGSC